MSVPKTVDQLILKQRPTKDTADFGDDLFELKKDVPLRELQDGEVLLKATAFSCDPTQRIWVTDEKQYMPPVAIGDPMRCLSGGVVVASKSKKFSVGDECTYFGGWETAHIRSEADPFLNKIPAGTPLHVVMALALTGATAYVGLIFRGELRPGQTVVVSGAAGATGSIAVQIAKMMKCKVIGTAGGAEKCKRVVEEFGADACIDYKSEDIEKRLAELCPDSINVFFDNVGGDVLDAALQHLAMNAKVVICGAISGYKELGVGGIASGPKNYTMLLMRRATMVGFIFNDNPSEMMEGIVNLGTWAAQGLIKVALDPRKAPFEKAASVVRNLFTSSNKGKLIHVIE